MDAVAGEWGSRIDGLLLDRWTRCPTQPAVVSDDEVVTAGQLRDRVLRVASALQASGVGPGDLVGVRLERSTEFVTAVLGVVVAGAAHVAFDPRDPVERTNGMIADCRPRALITEGSSVALFRDDTMAVLTPEECTAHPPGASLASPASWGDSPAVAIYTSGSTGRPKASLISHRALVSRLRALQHSHPIGEGDRIVHHTPCSFDMFLIEIYWPLVNGAAVVIGSPDRHRDADYLADLIHRHAITVLYCVVSRLDLFLHARDPAERYDGLRLVLTGGEPLGADLVRLFQARSTASLTNLYGPSECTIYCTAWDCPQDRGIDQVPIGSAIPDTDLWVVDEHGESVPDGEPGELYIGGDGLALGYLNQPELTAERFVPDHLGGSGGRLYRSGDLVRTTCGGTLEFLGRVDRQVKVRGFRIEPGEIESLARSCAGVRQAAVVMHGHGSEARLAGFLVVEPGAETEEIRGSVRTLWRTRLPFYAVPFSVEVIESLPLTPNGKMDRLLLAELAAARVRLAERIRTREEPTSSDLESVVAGIWRTILGVEKVGWDEDFFDLGGTSFGVLKVMERLEAMLGVRVPMSVLLEHPTINNFCAELVQLTTVEVSPGARRSQ